MQKENSYGTYGNGWFSVIKGAGLALAISLLSAVVFACILRATGLPDSIVYPVNQTVKAVSIAIGTLVFTRGEKGWLKGFGVALAFTALSYLAFSALGGDFSLSWLIFVELFVALLIGAVSGIVAVNLRR